MKTFLIVLWGITFILLLLVLAANFASCEQSAFGAEVKEGKVGQIYLFTETYRDGSERYFVLERKKEYHWLRDPNEKERTNLHRIPLRKWIWPHQIGE